MNRKTALITGASAGIGAEFARQLAAQGIDLVVTARRGDRLQTLAQNLQSEYGIICYPISADLAREQACREICQQLDSQGLQIDYLVNNAGYGVAGELTKPDWQTHRDFIQVLMTAVVELSYRLLPGMQQRGWGRIINVASLAGLVPGSPGHTLYGASKAFLISFSESVYFENRNTGVRVQALCPGFTYSEFHDVVGTRELVSKMPKSWWQTAEEVVRYSLLQIEKDDALPIAVPGRKNRRIARLTKLAPTRLLYNYMQKKARNYRALED